MEWLDVSVPIRPGMVSFPGDPVVATELSISIKAGGVCNVTRLDFGAHSGTHIDAPVHFIDGAPGIEGVPLGALVGPAVVVDATGLESHITPADLDAIGIPDGTERLLFKTKNSALWELPGFSAEFLGLTPEAASALVESGVLVRVLRCGVDGTDKEIASGEYGCSPEDDDFLIIGHESLGIVEAVGPNVHDPGLQPGSLVVATVRRPGSSIYDQIGLQD